MTERFDRAMSRWSGLPRIYWGEFVDTATPLNGEQEQYKRKLLEVESGKWWSLTVLGTVGNGKTRLASGLVELHNWRHPYTAVYVTQEQLVDRCKGTFSEDNESEASVLSKYMNVGLLVIDELTVRGWSEYAKNLIQKILSFRHSWHKATVIIGNLDKETFKGMFDEHILSRLREGETQIMVADDMRLHGEF